MNKIGIYLIVNIIDCKVYVGQTKNFDNRTHSYELFNGNDNSNLQSDYNNKKLNREFVYFIVANNASEEKLINYESLYITLLKEQGFKLYNKSYKYIDINSMSINTENVKKSLDEDFIKRFGLTPNELVNASIDKRKYALEKYVSRRIEKKFEGEEYTYDNLFFSIQRIKNIIGEIIKFNDFSKDELFFSSAGSYIGEGIEQILSYEIKSIAKHRYCLWTFGSRQIHKDTIQKLCMDRKKQNKDTYVLFNYTYSSKYLNTEKDKFCSLVIKENKFLTESDYLFLNLEKDKRGNFIVNEDIDCTATKANSALAFVIDELYFLEENIDFNNLKLNYLRVNKNLELSSKEHHGRNTSYVKLKENLSEDKLEYKFEDNTTRSFQFVAKLASPFVVRLDKNIKK